MSAFTKVLKSQLVVLILGGCRQGRAQQGLGFSVTWRAFLKRPENFLGPETVPQSSRNDFRVFLKAPEKF